MSEKKNKKKRKDYMSMFPWMNSSMPFAIPVPFDFGQFGKKDGEKKDKREKWDEFKQNADTIWGQLREMQDSSVDASRDQWQKFFDQVLDMQETFISSLPDEVLLLPGILSFLTPPISPKAFMEKEKEFRKTVNEYAVEQTDSFLDLCKQGQEQVKETVTEAVHNIEDKVDKVEEEKAEEKKDEEDKAEEKKPEAKKAEPKKTETKKAEPKKTTTKKTTTKKTPAKKVEPKKTEENKPEEINAEADNPTGDQAETANN